MCHYAHQPKRYIYKALFIIYKVYIVNDSSAGLFYSY